MIEPIRCYICHKSSVDLYWIDTLSEFICWHCIVAAVVVLARETATDNKEIKLTRSEQLGFPE